MPNGEPLWLNQTEWRISRHHLVPQCRGGKKRANIAVWPDCFHDLWHQALGIMTPKEALVYIDLATRRRDRRITRAEVCRVRNEIMSGHYPLNRFDMARPRSKDPRLPKRFVRKWRMLFGEMSFEQIVGFIREITEPGGKWGMQDLAGLVCHQDTIAA